MAATNPVANWFLKVGNQVHGPMSAAELRQQAAARLIGPDTPIRKGADGQWVRAENVQGLFSRGDSLPLPASPPPPPRTPPAPPSLPTNTPPVVSDSPRRMMISRRTWGLAAVVIVTVALLAGILLLHHETAAYKEVVEYPGKRQQAAIPSWREQSVPVTEQQQPNRKDDKSPEEIYTNTSPAVISLKIYNDRNRATFSGSGFILADRPAKPVQVDEDAKRFAADLADCATAQEMVKSLQDKIAPKELSSRSWDDQYQTFLKTRRGVTKRGLPNLQQVFIATNYHVIESAVSIRIRLHDGSIGFVSQIIQEDESADAAVLLAWFPDAKRLSGIVLSSVSPNVGARVFTIGSPLGLENSLSEGLISGVRELERGRSVLQITAAISHGSSGGPLLDSTGQVVGMTTAGLREGQNLNFAVPASEVSRLLERPPKPREVWRGRSVLQEELHAFDCAYTALKSKAASAAAAKLLLDSQEAVDCSLDGSNGLLLKNFKSVEEAEQVTIKATRLLPHDFEYLAYFYAGEFQRNQGLVQGALAEKKRETPAESAQRARLNPHYLAAIAAYRKAAELKPDFAPVYEGLESVHYIMNEWPEVRRNVSMGLRHLRYEISVAR